jgi:RNA polymerase sigma-70 factor (ECF subfamily)
MREIVDVTHSATDTVAGAVPDEVVLDRIRAGEAHAYGILVRRYNRRLFRVARGILRNDAEAQDAMQEAYVRAFLHLDRIDSPAHFGAWLTRITVNEALMKKRKSRNTTSLDVDFEQEDRAVEESSTAGSKTPENLAADGQLRNLLEEAVDRLPDSFRTVFILRAVQQLSVEETAESLDIPEATVKTRFHRARTLMQKEINRQVETTGLSVFEFAGKRCDRMVESVLVRIGARAAADDQDRLH